MDRKSLFDHLTDPTNWPSYYNNIIEVKPFDRFTEPGDTVAARFRLLGKAVDRDVELLVLEPPDRIRLAATAPGLPPLEHDWRYEGAGDGTRVHARRPRRSPVEQDGDDEPGDRRRQPVDVDGRLPADLVTIDHVDAGRPGTQPEATSCALRRRHRDPRERRGDLGHWSCYEVRVTVVLSTREVDVSSALDRPSAPRPSQLGVPEPARRFGYVAAAAVNGVALWVAHQLLDWGWPGFLTDGFVLVLGLVTASLVAGIVVNLALALDHRGRSRAFADLVTAAFALAVGLRMWEVFPFDFAGYATDWSGAVRIALGAAIVATGIAIIANLAKLLTGPDEDA